MKPIIVEAYEPSEDEKHARRATALLDLSIRAHKTGLYDLRDKLLGKAKRLMERIAFDEKDL